VRRGVLPVIVERREVFFSLVSLCPEFSSKYLQIFRKIPHLYAFHVVFFCNLHNPPHKLAENEQIGAEPTHDKGARRRGAGVYCPCRVCSAVRLYDAPSLRRGCKTSQEKI